MTKYLVPVALLFLIQCKQPDKNASQQKSSAPEPASTSAKKIFDYCYVNRKGVFVFQAGNPKGIHIKLNGSEPKLSPDGTQLAYTTASDSIEQRRIGLMDLTTLTTTILDTACHNCYGPVWSPDGKKLVYNAMQGQQWNIKCLQLETGQTGFVMKVAGNLGNFSPEWTSDSKQITMQDMAGLYVVDLNGTITRTIDLSVLDSTLMYSSSTYFLLAPSENKLIFDCQLSTDSVQDGEDGEPPPHIFAYNFDTRKLTLLGPTDHCCYNPVLKGDTIFCTGYSRKAGGKMNVYRMDLSGGHFQLAFKDGQDFSCRMQ